MLQVKINYFPNIVKHKNIFVFGAKELDRYTDIHEKFNSFNYQELTPYTLENLCSTLISLDTHALILTPESITDELIDKIAEIKRITELCIGLYLELPILLERNQDLLINNVDFVFTSQATPEQLMLKFYNIMYTETDTTDTHTDDKEAYKDAFEIDVMLLSEELLSLSKAIDQGDISDEVFKKLQRNISKVIQIVNGYMMSSKTIKQFIQVFYKYLTDFDRDNITIDTLEGFDYLARLVEDIAVFLNMYFIEKRFDDIYVVEDSLRNSFHFMKDKFAGKPANDDNSDIEFF